MKYKFIFGVIMLLQAYCAAGDICHDLGPIKETFLEMPKLDNDQLRVMSYNIRVDHEADQNTENKWEFRIDKVVSLIQNYNPDVIGLQEPNKSQIKDIL